MNYLNVDKHGASEIAFSIISTLPRIAQAGIGVFIFPGCHA